MAIEIRESLAGVGALIVTPYNRVLTVREKLPSLRTIKEAGMRTHPMESTNPGETSPFQTLRRITEEVRPFKSFKIREVIKFGGPLCDVQITDGTWVRTFLLLAKYEFPAEIGSDTNGVEDPLWMDVNEVLSSEIGNKRFRPGFREPASSWLIYKECIREGIKFQMLRYSRAVDEPYVLARLIASQDGLA